MSWTNRPSLKSGRGPRGLEWEAILDQIADLTAPGWVPYTTAWTSTGTAVAIGTSTVLGRYRRVPGTDYMRVEFRITFAGATFGTGDYRFSLPVAMSTNAQLTAVGAATLIDTGTTARPGTVSSAAASTVFIVSTTGIVGQTAPHTWANTDIVIVSIDYEPAT